MPPPAATLLAAALLAGALPYASLGAQGAAGEPAAPEEVRVETFVYAEAPADSAPAGTVELRLDLYRPVGASAAGPRPALVLMHGGGFVSGRRQLRENREVAVALASRGYVVASVDYRLWGDGPVVSGWARDYGERVSALDAPVIREMDLRYGSGWTEAVGAAAEDALRALAWMRTRGAELGVDADRIALGGMSAGALTALEVAYRLPRFGVDVPDISAVVSVRGAWLLAPEEEARPVRPDGPPLFVVHGTADDRVPFGRAVRTYRALQAVGTPVELLAIAGAGHELGGRSMLGTRLEDGSTVVERLDRFLRTAFQDPASLPTAVCLSTGGGCPAEESPRSRRPGEGIQPRSPGVVPWIGPRTPAGRPSAEDT